MEWEMMTVTNLDLEVVSAFLSVLEVGLAEVS